MVTAPPYGKIERLEIDRADFVALLDELCPAKAETTVPRGPKPGSAQRKIEVLKIIGQKLTNDEIDFSRGGKTKVAKELRAAYPEFEVDTIIRWINQENEGKADASANP
jgi:hypothetical protein